MFRRDLSTRLACSWTPKPTNLEKHFIKMKRVRGEDKVMLLSFSLLACSYFRKKEGGKGRGEGGERKIRKEETRGKIIKKRGDLLNNKR